jgi:signal transduction histidine kinase
VDGADHNALHDRDGRRAHEAAVSEVAHLFRTPLGVITGYAGLMQLRDDPDLRLDALRQIEEAAARLGSVVDLLVAALESESEGLAELLAARSRE